LDACLIHKEPPHCRSPFTSLLESSRRNAGRNALDVTANEEEEVYQLLSDNCQDFLKIALDNPDLPRIRLYVAHIQGLAASEAAQLK